MYTLRSIWRSWQARWRRTVLVIISVAVGILGLATVLGAQLTLEPQLRAGFLQSQPADIQVTTTGTTDAHLEAIKLLSNIADAEYVAVYHTRWQTNAGMGTLKIIAVPNLGSKHINQIQLEKGVFPTEGELLLERTAVRLLPNSSETTSDLSAAILTPLGEQQLPVSGIAYDPSVPSTYVQELAVGYMEMKAAQALFGEFDFSELHLHIQNQDDINLTAANLMAQMEELGLPVFAYHQRESHDFPGRDALLAILQLMNIFSLLGLALSGCIIANTVATVMRSEVPHIGTLKAIGAERKQVFAAYLPGFIGYGIVGSFLGLSGSLFAMNMLAAYLGRIANIQVESQILPVSVLGISLATGVLLPICVAWWPLWRTTRLPARDVLHSYGLATVTGLTVQWVTGTRVQFSYILWALRNVLHAGGRSVITAFTLTVAGLCFLAIFTIQASLGQTLNQIATTINADIFTIVGLPADKNELDKQLTGFNIEVATVEYWIRHQIEYSQEDTLIHGIPPNTEFYNYKDALIAGRWFENDEANSIIVTEKFLTDGLYSIGDTIRINIGDRSQRWQIVGAVRDYTNQGRLFLLSYASLSDMIAWSDEANVVLVRLHDRDEVNVSNFVFRYTNQLLSTGYEAETVTQRDLQQQGAAQMRIIIAFLSVTVLLVGSVAMLGLGSTLSIQVTERTREIGVMRALGGTGLQVAVLFWLESLWLGVISWIMVLLLGFPFTRWLVHFIGQTMFPVEYLLPPTAFIGWFICLLVLITIASVMPVIRAAQLRVSAVLRYG